jgi:hypothetical protein
MYGRLLRSLALASALAAQFGLTAEARNPRVIITRGQPSAPSAWQADPSELHLADFRQEALDQWSAGESDTAQPQSLLGDAADGQFGLDATQGSSCGCGSCGCESGECGSGLCDGDLHGISAHGHGLAVGVEATFLKPTFQNSNPGLDSEIELFQTKAAPRVWVQWQWPGPWGVRARYWDFDAEQSLQGATTAGNVLGAQLYRDELELYAIDLELTRNFNLGQWEMCGSFGARNGRFFRGQSLDLTVFDLEGGGGDDASVFLRNAQRDLNGTGITFAMGMRRPFFNRRLSAILNLRGSVIGNSNEFSLNSTVIEVVPVGAGDLDLASATTDEYWNRNSKSMWIGEVQVGGEWRTPLSRDYGDGNAFVQVLFEGQWWNLPGVGTSGPSTNDQLYQFVGVTCAAGFMR